MDFKTFAGRFSAYVRDFERMAVDETHLHAEDAEDFVREQLEAGESGNGRDLYPTYLNDPYFNEPGPWKGRARQYMRWKERITPPLQGEKLFLPPRPASVPNLRIRGDFHESIYAKPTGKGLLIGTSSTPLGTDIEEKYGSDIFRLGLNAQERMAAWVVARWEREWMF